MTVGSRIELTIFAAIYIFAEDSKDTAVTEA